MAEAGAIVDAVEARKYTRNETGERRHGFVSQDFDFIVQAISPTLLAKSPLRTRRVRRSQERHQSKLLATIV